MSRMNSSAAPASTMIALTHAPRRPSYDCSNCGQPWPCAPAKTELAEQYRDAAISLTNYLSSHMAEAMDQARHDPAWGRVNNLFDRFVGWTRTRNGSRNAG